MSILDDAIREHLELKRAHGADEAEVKRLEDEAFGPPGRPDEPDPLAEAPTEFMTQPEAPAAAEAAGEGSGRRINVADLQEPPPAPAEAAEPQEEPRIEATESVEAPHADAAAPLAPAEDTIQAAPPAEEEPLAIESEVVSEAEAPAEPAAPEPVAGAGPATEERHAIAEQPTELFDVESEMGTEDAPAAEIEASRAEPAQPPAADDDYDEDEEFWSDQRLSEELDNALEAPLTEEHPAPTPLTDEHDVPAPAPPVEEHDASAEHDEYEPKEPGHEDVLEDTPDFLEDAPEDDELWFEQRPPKDFDLD